MRIKFEELFFLQLKLLKQKLLRTEKYKGISFTKVGEFLIHSIKTIYHFPDRSPEESDPWDPSGFWFGQTDESSPSRGCGFRQNCCCTDVYAHGYWTMDFRRAWWFQQKFLANQHVRAKPAYFAWDMGVILLCWPVQQKQLSGGKFWKN